jgi:hypothetical protein
MGSQEQVRLQAGKTARGEKARGWKEREGVLTACKDKPEEGKAQEGIERNVI